MVTCFPCVKYIAVPGDDLACPREGVDAADTCRLGSNPQLQVLGAVIITDAVAVMHVLPWQEIPAKHLLHDENVLKNVASVACPRVLRRPDQRIPVLVPGPPASPIVVRCPALGMAGGTGGRLRLLAGPAGAEIVGPTRRAAQVAA